VLQSSGRTDQAEALVDEITAQEIDDVDDAVGSSLHLTLGLVRMRQGAIADAAELLATSHAEAAAAEDPWGRARSLSYLAEALRHLGRLERAADVLAEADRLAATVSPSASDSQLGRVLAAEHGIDLGDPSVALELGAHGLHGRPRTWALALAQSGRAGEAADELAGLVDEQPALRALLAFLLAAAGRDEEAMAQVEAVRSLAGAPYLDLVHAEVATALVAGHAGDRDATREALRRAARIADSTDDRLTAALVGLARACLLGDDDGEQGVRELGIEADGWRSLFASVTVAPAASS
jgi:tetratricopeptide (TPR) repeat protein